MCCPDTEMNCEVIKVSLKQQTRPPVGDLWPQCPQRSWTGSGKVTICQEDSEESMNLHPQTCRTDTVQHWRAVFQLFVSIDHLSLMTKDWLIMLLCGTSREGGECFVQALFFFVHGRFKLLAYFSKNLASLFMMVTNELLTLKYFDLHKCFMSLHLY